MGAGQGGRSVMPAMRVAVVGGGISGLATAYFLVRSGCRVVVLEREAGAGGTIRSTREGGFLWEGGPNSAAETTPVIDELLGALGIREQRLYAAEGAKCRYVLRAGRLHALPTGPAGFLSTPLWSVRGKLRLALEPFVPRARHEESVAEFVSRRLGREFLDYAIDPFVAGVYAGNPRRLSVQAAFPKLYELEQRYGSLIKGALLGARARRKRPDRARPAARLFSFRDGMATLPDALVAALGDAVHAGARVRGVAATDDGFRIVFDEAAAREEERFDAVVLSVPAYTAADLIREWLPTLAGRLGDVKYPPVAVAALGYRRGDLRRELDGFGYLVPEVERRRILGTIWNSSLFPGRAPEGCVLLTSFLGGARQPEYALRSEEEILQLAHEENAAAIGLGAPPMFSRVQRWRRAIPQYNLGHLATVAAIEEAEGAHPGFYVCSNYRGGIALGDCLASAKRTAERVLERAS